MIAEKLRKLWKAYVVDYYCGPSECFDCNRTECNPCSVLQDALVPKKRINIQLSKNKAQLVLPLRFIPQNSFSSSRGASKKANPQGPSLQNEPSQQSSPKEYQPHN
jgi:hypothetical protein